MRRNISTRPEMAARVVGLVGLGKGVRVLDLGCGDGVFLEAAAERLKAEYPSQFGDADALAGVVTGVEQDVGAGARAEERLTTRFGKPSSGWDIRIADALWLGEEEKYEVVVGNPPWVRLHDLDASTRAEARSKFRTARGPFDLCYLFVEKALRMLAAGGELALIVPRGIQYQPAAGPLRDLLTTTGSWTVEAVSRECFVPRAGVDPAILRVVKHERSARIGTVAAKRPPVFGDLAVIGTGVATGADSVFLVRRETVEKLGLERGRLRRVIRGRDIRPGARDVRETSMRLIWPYRRRAGRWMLDDLSGSPRVRGYLEQHKGALAARPRLARCIEREPSTWYRFIDPQRLRGWPREPRIAVADIFREPAFVVVEDERTVVLNTCFQVLPRAGCEGAVMAALESSGFWERLRGASRALSSGYHRTSVAELRSNPLTGAAL